MVVTAEGLVPRDADTVIRRKGSHRITCIKTVTITFECWQEHTGGQAKASTAT
jgi:hypothetical protein